MAHKKDFLIFFIDRVQFPNSYIIKLERNGNSDVYSINVKIKTDKYVKVKS